MRYLLAHRHRRAAAAAPRSAAHRERSAARGRARRRVRGTGAAEAVVVDAGGGPPGITTTRVPTLTRSNRSETSSFSMPMQPEETNLPIVEGWLVPWMR